VVVAAGLTLADPLADMEVNVPGVMAILIAPVLVQLRVLLAPEFMVVGFAAKDVIAGTAPFSGDEPDEPPQPANPAQANRVRKSAQRDSPDKQSRRELEVFLQSAVESMYAPCIAVTCLTFDIVNRSRPDHFRTVANNEFW
jgi:hypothetical protein